MVATVSFRLYFSTDNNINDKNNNDANDESTDDDNRLLPE